MFRQGTQVSSSGEEITYTAEDLQQMADTYNTEVHEAPITIGHEADQAWDRPLSRKSQLSNGWLVGAYLGDDGSLYGDIEVDDGVYDAIKTKKLKKRSIGLYNPDSNANPNKGQWSIRHLALLGSEPPAVKGLKDITIYSEGVVEGLVYSEVEHIEEPETTITMFGEQVGTHQVKNQERHQQVLQKKWDSVKVRPYG